MRSLDGPLRPAHFPAAIFLEGLGLDVCGRSFQLWINYRTAHQIRLHADRLLSSTVSDADGNAEVRRGTISMFDGPPPLATVCEDTGKEAEAVGTWIAERLGEGCQPHEIGVFVRSGAGLTSAGSWMCSGS